MKILFCLLLCGLTGCSWESFDPNSPNYCDTHGRVESLIGIQGKWILLCADGSVGWSSEEKQALNRN